MGEKGVFIQVISTMGEGECMIIMMMIIIIIIIIL